MSDSELKREMGEGFASVKQEFAKVSEQFAQVDQRFAQVDERFVEIDARLVAIESKIVTEGQTTRRHFDIVAEKFQGEMRLSLDRSMATADQVTALSAVNATEHAGFAGVIDDHEARLKALEGS